MNTKIFSISIFLFAYFCQVQNAIGADTDSNFNKRPWNERVLYFTVIDRFHNGNFLNDQAHGDSNCNHAGNIFAYNGGDLQGLASQLNYIRELGADALWITPLYKGVPQKQGRNCGYPGYWADFKVPYDLEIDPRFGDVNDFDQLISSLQKDDIKIMLDMVVNHSGYGAEITKTHPHWFNNPKTCDQNGKPEIDCPLAGLPDFNQSNPNVADYLLEIHKKWVERFDLDAIRMDTVKHVPASYFNFWNSSIKKTSKNKHQNKEVFILGEILEEYSFDLYKKYLNAGFDSLFNFPLRRALIDTFARGHSVDGVASKLMDTLYTFGEKQSSKMVNLLDNHDVPRFLEYMPPNISSIEVNKRYKMALLALLTLPGIPQIYYGNEIGMYGGVDPYNRRPMPEWALESQDVKNPVGYVSNPMSILSFVKHLLKIRSVEPALRRGRYHEVWRQNGSRNANIWAYIREDLKTKSSVLVVINNGSRKSDSQVPIGLKGLFKDGTILKDLLNPDNDNNYEVRDNTLFLNLKGKSSLILKSSKGM